MWVRGAFGGTGGLTTAGMRIAGTLAAVARGVEATNENRKMATSQGK